MNKLCIVMPAYNEEKRIGKTLEEYSSFFENKRKNEKFNYEIMVVINNTKDRTLEIVKEISKKNKNIKYLDLPKGGKGYAVIEGFKAGIETCELVGFVDADMATSPDQYWNLVKNIGKYDGIIADRYIKGSKVYPPVTFRRLVVGRIFNFIVRAIMILPYRDTQCGAKLFKKEALEKIIPQLTMSKWAFDVELLYKLNKNGFRVKSYPTIWVDKEYSKINFVRATPGMLLGIMRLRLINSPFRRLAELYDKFVAKHIIL